MYLHIIITVEIHGTYDMHNRWLDYSSFSFSSQQYIYDINISKAIAKEVAKRYPKMTNICSSESSYFVANSVNVILLFGFQLCKRLNTK